MPNAVPGELPSPGRLLRAWGCHRMEATHHPTRRGQSSVSLCGFLPSSFGVQNDQDLHPETCPLAGNVSGLGKGEELWLRSTREPKAFWPFLGERPSEPLQKILALAELKMSFVARSVIQTEHGCHSALSLCPDCSRSPFQYAFAGPYRILRHPDSPK